MAELTAFSPAPAQSVPGLSLVPVSLFQDVGKCRITEDRPTVPQRRRARPRRAGIGPLWRISATGISIFGPLAAATSSDCPNAVLCPGESTRGGIRWACPVASRDLPFNVVL